MRDGTLSYRSHRFPSAIITHAFWLYYRFTLIYRDIEDLLAERGITESGTAGRLLIPILVHLIDETGNSVMGIPQEEFGDTLDAAAEEIPGAVVGIYKFWRENA